MLTTRSSRGRGSSSCLRARRPPCAGPVVVAARPVQRAPGTRYEQLVGSCGGVHGDPSLARSPCSGSALPPLCSAPLHATFPLDEPAGTVVALEVHARRGVEASRARPVSGRRCEQRASWLAPGGRLLGAAEHPAGVVSARELQQPSAVDAGAHDWRRHLRRGDRGAACAQGKCGDDHRLDEPTGRMRPAKGLLPRAYQ